MCVVPTRGIAYPLASSSGCGESGELHNRVAWAGTAVCRPRGPVDAVGVEGAGLQFASVFAVGYSPSEPKGVGVSPGVCSAARVAVARPVVSAAATPFAAPNPSAAFYR